MDVIKIKHYLCVVCQKAEITERIIEHRYDGEVPDQNNCDLSTYSGHEIIGGKILKNHPPQLWQTLTLIQLREKYGEPEVPKPLGGICENCLQDETIAFLATGKHINFATADELRRSRY